MMKPGTVFKLKNEIEYKSGKPVVEKVIDGETEKLFLIAIEKGELSEHPAPLNALVTVLAGEGTITYEGKPYKVEKGDSFIFAKGAMHSVSTKKKIKFSLFLTEAGYGA